MNRAGYWIAKISPLLQNFDAENNPEKLVNVILENNFRKTDRIQSLVEGYHGRLVREFEFLPLVAVELPQVAFEEIARSRIVYKIWSDVKAKILLDVAVSSVGGRIAQRKDYYGEGSVVAIIDTGIYMHDDLIKPENRILAWYDLINNQLRPYDDHGHGTHIAGIIAGNGYTSGEKYVGMAPKAKLVGVKVLNREGTGSISDIIAGIEWCIKNAENLNIRVMNLSFGAPAQESYRTDPLCRITSVAWRKGITVCVAGGNEGPKLGTIGTPGINPRVITVGNIDDKNTINREDDRLNWSSSIGPTRDHYVKPDLVAPGTEITSLSTRRGDYITFTGTSMATGFVSGAAALIVEKWPKLKPDQIKKLLMRSSKNLGLGVNLQGAGVLNLEKVFKGAYDKAFMAQENMGRMLGYNLIKIITDNTGLKTSQLNRKLDRMIEDTIYNFFRS